MFATIIDGHPLLSEWFLLIAVICFALEVVAIVTESTRKHAVLIPLGLAFLAAAWLVL